MPRIAALLACSLLLSAWAARASAQPPGETVDASGDAAEEGGGGAPPDSSVEAEVAPSNADEIPMPPPAGQEVAPAPPPPVAGMTLSPAFTNVDVARLDAWLGSFDGSARVLRYIAAPLGIVAGAALVGIGVWFVADDTLTIGSRQATLGLSAAMIAIGAMSVGIGIYNFAAETPAEELYARFAAARERGLDARTLGRFEGEFRAMAEVSRLARYISIVAGFALALGGGIAMGVSALEDREEPRTIGLVTGGGLAIGGAMMGALSFIESPYERAWERYDLGLMPDGSTPTARVTPIVGRYVAGLGVQGRF